MQYYISDMHLGDQRVFDKCHRPFSGLDEMEDVIIKNWNAKVHPEDIVYVLGDIAEDHYDKSISVIGKLNGRKCLIIGNHDLLMESKYRESGLFESVDFMKLIIDNGRKVCLCHYPVMDWMEFSRGGYLVYGHVHNKTALNDIAYVQMKEFFKDKLGFNCGVDVTGFEPVTLDEMIRLKEKNKDAAFIN